METDNFFGLVRLQDSPAGVLGRGTSIAADAATAGYRTAQLFARIDLASMSQEHCLHPRSIVHCYCRSPVPFRRTRKSSAKRDWAYPSTGASLIGPDKRLTSCSWPRRGSSISLKTRAVVRRYLEETYPSGAKIAGKFHRTPRETMLPTRDPAEVRAKGALEASAAYMIWTGMATPWMYRGGGWDECVGSG